MEISDSIDRAVAVVKQGGLLAYPTEAVFGLGCDPNNQVALQNLLMVKQRDPRKGFIIIAASLEQLDGYIQPLSLSVLERITPTWPGPVTWLLPAHPDLSPFIKGQHSNVAVRVSAHPTCQNLCNQLQHPLISTSANLSGEQAARTPEQVMQQLAHTVDFILDQPLGNLEKPTEIRDAILNTIIRNG